MHYSLFVLLSCCLALTSCSFKPMLKNPEHVSVKKMTISIEKKGYITHKLSDLLERKKNLMEAHLKADAALFITFKEANQSVGYTPEGDTNRMHYTILVDLTLKQGTGEKKIRIDCVSSYNTNDDFTTDQTKDHVQTRLLNQLSDQIIRKTISLMD
ncbi:MAG: hypothetical protein CNLJKLNK_00253 [Holosporales bacterium]